MANGCIFSNWDINRDWHNKNLIIFFLMSNKVEPMVFIETDDYSVYESAVSQLEFIRESMRPPYMRQFAMVEERIRNLWQEEPMSQSSESSGVYSGDDEMEVDIKEETEIPKVIFDTEDLPCTSNNGACSECELSRTAEEASQSEETNATCEKLADTAQVSPNSTPTGYKG